MLQGKEKEIICRGSVPCWEETRPQQGTGCAEAGDSVGRDATGGREGGTILGPITTAGFILRAVGSHCRRVSISEPQDLEASHGFGLERALVEYREALESIVLAQSRVDGSGSAWRGGDREREETM